MNKPPQKRAPSTGKVKGEQTKKGSVQVKDTKGTDSPYDPLVSYLPGGVLTTRNPNSAKYDPAKLKSFPMSDILEQIKNPGGKLKAMILRARELRGTPRYDIAKKKIPAFRCGYSTRITNDAGNEIDTHTSLVPLDVENATEETLARIEEDKASIYARFKSLGGVDECIIFRMASEDFKANAVALEMRYNVPSTKGQNSEDRCRVMSFDPALYSNPFAVPLDLSGGHGQTKAEAEEPLNNGTALSLYSRLRRKYTMRLTREIMERRSYDSVSLNTPELRVPYFDKWEKQYADSYTGKQDSEGKGEDAADESVDYKPRLKELRKEFDALIPTLPDWLKTAASAAPMEPGMGVFAALVLSSFYQPGRRLVKNRPMTILGMLVGNSASTKGDGHRIVHGVLDPVERALAENFMSAKEDWTKDSGEPYPVADHVLVGFNFSDAAIERILVKNRLMLHAADLNGFLSSTQDWQKIDRLFLNCFDGVGDTILRSDGKGGHTTVRYDNPELACLDAAHTKFFTTGFRY